MIVLADFRWRRGAKIYQGYFELLSRLANRDNRVCFLPIKERSAPRDKNRESQRHRRNGPHPAESPGTAHPLFA
jgi:Na+-transporting NADH:ubiquinone oxidoreductase subunit NqrA